MLDEDRLPPPGRVLPVPEGGQAVAVGPGGHREPGQRFERGVEVDVGRELADDLPGGHASVIVPDEADRFTVGG